MLPVGLDLSVSHCWVCPGHGSGGGQGVELAQRGSEPDPPRDTHSSVALDFSQPLWAIGFLHFVKGGLN